MTENSIFRASKGVLEFYVKDCRKACKLADGLVSDFKTSKEKIAKNCKAISETLLVLIKKKVVYEEGQFEQAQQVPALTAFDCSTYPPVL